MLESDYGIGNLIMADGPAGLRLQAEFDTDINGRPFAGRLAIPFAAELLGAASVSREEWGFDGIIMIDWLTTTPDKSKAYPASSPGGCIMAVQLKAAAQNMLTLLQRTKI